jgi:hypothetical protein
MTPVSRDRRKVGQREPRAAEGRALHSSCGRTGKSPVCGRFEDVLRAAQADCRGQRLASRSVRARQPSTDWRRSGLESRRVASSSSFAKRTLRLPWPIWRVSKWSHRNSLRDERRLLLLCKLLWTLSRVFAIRPVEHCYIETTISFCVGHAGVAAATIASTGHWSLAR